MGQHIDLNKNQILEILGNNMILTVTLNGSQEICVRVESEKGGKSISVRSHDEDDQTIVFYLKDEDKPPQFRIV